MEHSVQLATFVAFASWCFVTRSGLSLKNFGSTEPSVNCMQDGTSLGKEPDHIRTDKSEIKQKEWV